MYMDWNCRGGRHGRASNRAGQRGRKRSRRSGSRRARFPPKANSPHPLPPMAIRHPSSGSTQPPPLHGSHDAFNSINSTILDGLQHSRPTQQTLKYPATTRGASITHRHLNLLLQFKSPRTRSPPHSTCPLPQVPQSRHSTSQTRFPRKDSFSNTNTPDDH